MVDISFVTTICCILSALIKKKDHLDVVRTMQEDQQKQLYEAYFLFACMWAICGCA